MQEITVLKRVLYEGRFYQMRLEHLKIMQKCLKKQCHLVPLEVRKWLFWVSFLLVLGAIRYQKSRIVALDEKR